MYAILQIHDHLLKPSLTEHEFVRKEKLNILILKKSKTHI